MKQPTLTFSVIVCAYTEERWNDLLAAVQSLHAQTLAPSEIVVVIDHNPALFARAMQSIQGVILLENQQARGLSGARNTGLAVASGSVIAFMDEDAAAAPDWLTRLADTLHDPGVIGVGGAILPIWPNERPAWFPVEFDWVVGCTYRGMPESAAPVRNLIGCNMAFRREVFTLVGGFRDGIGRIGTFPAGCEETELCIRAQQRLPGSRFIYQPGAQVHHRVSTVRTHFAYFRRRCYAEGLSKALVARLVGQQAGLSSERTYVLRSLPVGVWAGLRDAVTRARPAGLLRAAAILFGLGATTAGYLVGKASLWAQPGVSLVPLPSKLEKSK